jgi:hypothetical protein
MIIIMYSPTKENNKIINNVRMGINPKKHIIKGTRKIKSNEELKKNQTASHSI